MLLVTLATPIVCATCIWSCTECCWLYCRCALIFKPHLHIHLAYNVLYYLDNNCMYSWFIIQSECCIVGHWPWWGRWRVRSALWSITIRFPCFYRICLWCRAAFTAVASGLPGQAKTQGLGRVSCMCFIIVGSVRWICLCSDLWRILFH